jgi:hypothetical protein
LYMPCVDEEPFRTHDDLVGILVHACSAWSSRVVFLKRRLRPPIHKTNRFSFSALPHSITRSSVIS